MHIPQGTHCHACKIHKHTHIYIAHTNKKIKAVRALHACPVIPLLSACTVCTAGFSGACGVEQRQAEQSSLCIQGGTKKSDREGARGKGPGMMQGTGERKMQRPRKQEPRPVGIEDGTANKCVWGAGMPPVHSEEVCSGPSLCHCVFPCVGPHYFGRYCSQFQKRLESRKSSLDSSLSAGTSWQ